MDHESLAPFVHDSDDHRRHRLELMGIELEDKAVVDRVHEYVIQPNHQSIIDAFYAFLLEHQDTRRFLENPATLARLKSAHSTYLTNFGRGFEEAAYFEYRLRVGLTHLRIGLPLHLYLAAYRRLQMLLFSYLDHLPTTDNGVVARSADVVAKFVLLDLSLAIDAYNTTQLESLSHSIDELENEKSQLNVQLMFDALTNVYSRRYILESLKTRLVEYERDETKAFALGLIDLDDFKEVNDTHGHQAGDAVLYESAQVVQLCIRGHDMLGRYGGEEFVLLLMATDIENARQIAERIRTNVSAHAFSVGGRSLTVTVSVGLTMARCGDTVNSLIRRADRAVYQAKAGGRNQTRVI